MTPDDLAAHIARAVASAIGRAVREADVSLRPAPRAWGHVVTPAAATVREGDLPVVCAAIAAVPGVARVEPAASRHVVVDLHPDTWTAATRTMLTHSPTLDPDPGILNRETAEAARYVHARICATLLGAQAMGTAYSPSTADVSEAFEDVCEVLVEAWLVARTWRTARTRARAVPPLVASLTDHVLDLLEQHPPLPRGDDKETPVHHARLLTSDSARVALASVLIASGLDAPERL